MRGAARPRSEGVGTGHQKHPLSCDRHRMRRHRVFVCISLVVLPAQTPEEYGRDRTRVGGMKDGGTQMTMTFPGIWL